MFNIFEGSLKKTAAFDTSIFKRKLKDDIPPLSPDAEKMLKEISGKDYDSVVALLTDLFNKKGAREPHMKSRLFEEWLIDAIRTHFKTGPDSDIKGTFAADGFLSKMDAKEYSEAFNKSEFVKLLSQVIDHLNVDLALHYTSSTANIKHIIENIREDFKAEAGDLEDSDYWKHEVKVDKDLLRKFDLTTSEASKPIKSEKELLPHIARFMGLKMHFGDKILPDAQTSNQSYALVRSQNKGQMNTAELSRNKKTIEEMLKYLSEANPETAAYIKAQAVKHGGGNLEGYVDRLLKILSKPTEPSEFDDRFYFFFGVKPDTDFAHMPFEDFKKSLGFIKKKHVDDAGNVTELTKERLDAMSEGLSVSPIFYDKEMHQKDKGQKDKSLVILDEIKNLPVSEGVKILSSYFKLVRDAKKAAGEELSSKYKEYLEGDLVANAERHLTIATEKESPNTVSDPISVIPGKVSRIKLVLKNVLAPFKPFDPNDPTDPNIKKDGESPADFITRREKEYNVKGHEVRSQLKNLKDLIKESIPPTDVINQKMDELKQAYKSLSFSDDKKEDKLIRGSILDFSGSGPTISKQLTSKEGYTQALENIKANIEMLTTGTSSDIKSLKTLERDLTFLEKDYTILTNIINAVNNGNTNPEAFEKNIKDIRTSYELRGAAADKALEDAKSVYEGLKTKYPDMLPYLIEDSMSSDKVNEIEDSIKEKLRSLKDTPAEYSKFYTKLREIRDARGNYSSIKSKASNSRQGLSLLKKDIKSESDLRSFANFTLEDYENITKDINSFSGKVDKALTYKEKSLRSKKLEIDDVKKKITSLEDNQKFLEGTWEVVKDKVQGPDFESFLKKVESFKSFVQPYSDRAMSNSENADKVTHSIPSKSSPSEQVDFRALKPGDLRPEESLEQTISRIEQENTLKRTQEVSKRPKADHDPKYNFKSLDSLYDKANNLYNLFNNLSKHISVGSVAGGRGGRFFEYVQDISPVKESQGVKDSGPTITDPQEYLSVIDDVVTKLELFDSRKLLDILNNKILKISDPSINQEELKKTVNDYVKALDGLRKDIRSLQPDEMFAKLDKYLTDLNSLAFLKRTVKIASRENPFEVAYNLRIAAVRILEAATTDKGADWLLYGERYVNVGGETKKVSTPKMFEFTDYASQFIDSLLSHGFDFFKNPKNFQDANGKHDPKKFEAALENKVNDVVAKVVLKGSDNFEKHIKGALSDSYIKSNEKAIKDFASKKERIEKMQTEIVEIKEKYLGKLADFSQFMRDPRKSIGKYLSGESLERFEGETGESVSKEDLDEFKSAVYDKDIEKIKSMLSPQNLEFIDAEYPRIWEGLTNTEFNTVGKPQKDPLAKSILDRLVALYEKGTSSDGSSIKEFKAAIKNKDVGKIKTMLPEEALNDPYINDILNFIGETPEQNGISKEIFGDTDPADYIIDLFKGDRGAIAVNRKRLRKVLEEKKTQSKDIKSFKDKDFFRKKMEVFLRSLNARGRTKYPSGLGVDPQSETLIKTYYDDFETFSKKLDTLNDKLNQIDKAKDNNSKQLREIAYLIRGYNKELSTKDFNMDNISSLFVDIKDMISGETIKPVIQSLQNRVKDEWLASAIDRASNKIDSDGKLGKLRTILEREKSTLFKKDDEYTMTLEALSAVEETYKKYKKIDELKDAMNKTKGKFNFFDEKRGIDVPISTIAKDFEAINDLIEEMKKYIDIDSKNTKSVIKSIISLHNVIEDMLGKVRDLETRNYSLNLRDLSGEHTYKLVGIKELEDFVTTFEKYENDLKAEQAKVQQQSKSLVDTHKKREVTRVPLSKSDEAVLDINEAPGAPSKPAVTPQEEIDVPMSFAEKFKRKMVKEAGLSSDIITSDFSFLDRFKSVSKLAGTGEPEEKGPLEIPSNKKLESPLYGIEDKETLEFILNRNIKEVKKIDDLVRELEPGSGIDKLNSMYLKQLAVIKRKGTKQIHDILNKDFSVGGETLKLDDIPYRFRELLDTFQDETNKRVLNINKLKKDIVKHKYTITEMKNHVDLETREVKDVSPEVIEFYKKIFFKDLLIALNSYWNTNSGKFNLFGEKDQPAYNEIYDTINNIVGTNVKPGVWKQLTIIDDQLRQPLERDVIQSAGISDDVQVKEDRKSRLAEVNHYIKMYEKVLDLGDAGDDSNEVIKVQNKIKDYKNLSKEKKKLLEGSEQGLSKEEALRLEELSTKLNETSLDKLENEKKRAMLNYYYGTKSTNGVAHTLEYLYNEVDRLESLKNLKGELFTKLREVADEKIVADTLKTLRNEIEKGRSEITDKMKAKSEYLEAIKGREESVTQKEKALEETSAKIQTELANVPPVQAPGKSPVLVGEKETPIKNKGGENFARELIKGTPKKKINFLKSLVSESRNVIKSNPEFFKSDSDETKNKAYNMLVDMWKDELSSDADILDKITSELPKIVRNLGSFEGVLKKEEELEKVAADYESSPHFNSKHLYSKALQDKIASMLDI